MIGVLSYGLGNVNAFLRAYQKLGIKTKVVQTPEDFKNVSRIILPGVGSFDWAIKKLKSSHLLNNLNELVIHQKVPILGICVGMQMFANLSEEGDSTGLGWIDSEVIKFDAKNESKLRLPHMGWNRIKLLNNHPVFKNLNNSSFYFLHSYYFKPKDTSQIISTSNYHINFCSSVCKDNIIGVQFHPEKSHASGHEILRNFSNY